MNNVSKLPIKPRSTIYLTLDVYSNEECNFTAEWDKRFKNDEELRAYLCSIFRSWIKNNQHIESVVLKKQRKMKIAAWWKRLFTAKY